MFLTELPAECCYTQNNIVIIIVVGTFRRHLSSVVNVGDHFDFFSNRKLLVMNYLRLPKMIGIVKSVINVMPSRNTFCDIVCLCFMFDGRHGHHLKIFVMSEQQDIVIN